MSDRISKAQFLRHLRKGWETLGFTYGSFWGATPRMPPRLGKAVDKREDVKCACAVGAAAYAAGMTPREYSQLLPTDAALYIVSLNDNAGKYMTDTDDETKKKVILMRVEEMEWA